MACTRPCHASTAQAVRRIQGPTTPPPSPSPSPHRTSSTTSSSSSSYPTSTSNVVSHRHSPPYYATAEHSHSRHRWNDQLSPSAHRDLLPSRPPPPYQRKADRIRIPNNTTGNPQWFDGTSFVVSQDEQRNADVKGKARAYDDPFKVFNDVRPEMTLAQDSDLNLEYIEAMANRGGKGMIVPTEEQSGSQHSPPSTKTTLSSETASMSKVKSSVSPTTFSDPFDWRQTATSFRKAHMAKDPRSRKTPSRDALNRTNTRSPALKARVDAYQDQLNHLALLERACEQAEWDELRSRSLEQLISGGWAVDGLVGYWQGGDRPQTGTSSLKKSKQQIITANSRPRVAILSRLGLHKIGWSRLKEGDRVELRPSASIGKTVSNFMPEEELLPSSTTLNGKRKKWEERETKTDFRLFATIISNDAFRLHLLFSPPHNMVDLEACQSWRLDLAPNDLIEAKVDEAIDCLEVDLPGLEASKYSRKWQARGCHLTEPLLPRDEKWQATEENTSSTPSTPTSIFHPDWRIRSWYERYSRPNPLVMEGDPVLRLNASQMKAVATMLSSRLSLIQGPPGTGKTHTLISTIKLLKHHFAVPHPVLLCAHTHVAVDNLASSAIDAGLNVVRIGSNTGLGAQAGKIEEVTLAHKMTQHKLWPVLEATRAMIGGTKRQITALFDRVKKSKAKTESVDEEAEIASNLEDQADKEESLPPSSKPSSPSAEGKEEIAALYKQLSRLRQQAYIVTLRIETTILYEADVVCSTLISSSSASLRCIDFPLVFIDECTQAQEVLSLIPLMKGARQVALIGDHKQLPPVLKSGEAKKQGGARSLFERLVEEDGWAARSSENDREPSQVPGHRRTKMQMLQVQHRMHPILASFPNQQFYSGKLESAIRTKDVLPVRHSLAKPEELDSTGRLVFIDHPGLESVSRSATEVSLRNVEEIELIMHLLYDLLSPAKADGEGAGVDRPTLQVEGSSIGIIAPYLAQARLIRRILRPLAEEDFDHPLRRALEKHLGSNGIKELEKVEVNTVDGFQGREKDIIIFSAVRCSYEAAAATTAATAATTATSSNNVSSVDEHEQEGETPSELDSTPRVRRTSNVGFLADARRLNVALTRAKSALFVLGNLDTWKTARSQRGSGSSDHSTSADASADVDADAGSGSGSGCPPLKNFARHIREKGLVVSGEQLRRLVDLLPRRGKAQDDSSGEVVVGPDEAVDWQMGEDHWSLGTYASTSTPTSTPTSTSQGSLRTGAKPTTTQKRKKGKKDRSDSRPAFSPSTDARGDAAFGKAF